MSGPAIQVYGQVSNIDDRNGGVMETDSLKETLALAQDSAGRLGGIGRTASAQDASGAVTVTVSASGAVIQAQLHDQWQARLRSADFSSAVAEAIAGAQRQAAQGWAEDAAEPSAAAPSAVEAERRSDPPEQAPLDFARDLMALLDDVERSLPDLADVAQRAVDQEVRVEGPAGGITAVARQGVLVELTINPQWMREAPRNRVEEELTAVLAKALPGLTQQASGALREVAPVGRLLGILDDPENLFACLGLNKPPS